MCNNAIDKDLKEMYFKTQIKSKGVPRIDSIYYLGGWLLILKVQFVIIDLGGKVLEYQKEV